uniref:Uncharacterized protein n=1 Tax=Rhizophora mucronata TaxID=61149 RepID=A0A2P2K032_RHIMU
MSSNHQSDSVLRILAPVVMPFQRMLPPGLCKLPYIIMGHPNKLGSVHAIIDKAFKHLLVIWSFSALCIIGSQL